LAALVWTLACVFTLVDEEVSLAFVCIFAPRPGAFVSGFLKMARLKVILQSEKIFQDIFAVDLTAFLSRLAQTV
jgi:hypothetical protein